MKKEENPFGKNIATLLQNQETEISLAKTALDIGCAYGANAYYLASLGINVDAIDKLLPATPPNPLIKFQKCDILNFSFEKKYDIILAFNILQFLSKDDKYAVLKRIAKSLTANGLLFIQSFSEKDPSFGKSINIKSHFAKKELLN